MDWPWPGLESLCPVRYRSTEPFPTGTRTKLKDIPPYTPADWANERAADKPDVALACPNCGRTEWYHPVGIPPADGAQRKYRACKVCGFWQEADGTAAYRCSMTVHTCLAVIAENTQCEYCAAWGPVRWHAGCWRILPAEELGVTTCKNCGVVLTSAHVIPWPVTVDGEHLRLLRTVTVAALVITVLAVGVVLAALFTSWSPSNGWLMVAIFAATATAPHWMVEGFARLAIALSPQLAPGDHVVGFRNIGAYLGLLERSLFLGALVAGQPGFIAVWFVFKGIAGYRVGLPETRARRTFQLFLLNNAVSVAGVALGWLVWRHLGFS